MFVHLAKPRPTRHSNPIYRRFAAERMWQDNYTAASTCCAFSGYHTENSIDLQVDTQFLWQVPYEGLEWCLVWRDEASPVCYDPGLADENGIRIMAVYKHGHTSWKSYIRNLHWIGNRLTAIRILLDHAVTIKILFVSQPQVSERHGIQPGTPWSTPISSWVQVAPAFPVKLTPDCQYQRLAQYRFPDRWDHALPCLFILDPDGFPHNRAVTIPLHCNVFTSFRSNTDISVTHHPYRFQGWPNLSFLFGFSNGRIRDDVQI